MGNQNVVNNVLSLDKSILKGSYELIHEGFESRHHDFGDNLMERNIQPREYGWTDSSDTNISVGLLEEELEPDLLSSEDDEVPFTRHGPIVEPDPKDIAIQRGFWNFCAIGFILDYRKFSVRHLQHIINNAWCIRGEVSIVGRDSYFYIFHFEFMEDLHHICNGGPLTVDGALLVFGIMEAKPSYQ